MDMVAIESKSHQAIRHLGTEASHYRRSQYAGTWRGRKLSGLKEVLSVCDFDMSFIDLESETLDDVDILVISGRYNSICFTDPELKSIVTFYNRGGGLFLMANHKVFVEPQNQVARILFPHVIFHEETILEDRQQLNLNLSHPISQNCQQGLKIRTSCTMSVRNSSETMVLISNKDPKIGDFAAAIEQPGNPSKRSVVITSAGHISSLDDSRTWKHQTKHGHSMQLNGWPEGSQNSPKAKLNCLTIRYSRPRGRRDLVAMDLIWES